ncbi:MAG: MFS transporter [Rhodospirillaceae bacterium]
MPPPAEADESVRERAGRPGRAAWALYDWANSAFPTAIITFVFSAYFTKAIAETPERGTELWGYAISLSALAVAVLSPLLGAISDHAGPRKPWIFTFSIICIILCFGLWHAAPEARNILWVLVAVGVANLAFEMAAVFYNAMLPDIARPTHIGRLSGWAWGLGYFGGIACLVGILVLFVQPEVPAFGLSADKDKLENVRAVGPFVGAWFAVFCLPMLFLTPDTPATGVGIRDAVRRGARTLAATIRNLRQYRDIARYLLARMIYTDGLNTLFAFGGIYAAGTFGMETDEIIKFGIALNVTAGIGAFAFAWIDDWIGPKRTILISVWGLLALSSAILLIEDKALFWIVGPALGLFVGPAQSASRSMMARMAPADMRAEMFGLYALSGKATAFLGPALLAWTTGYFMSQRAGMATILLFFAAGIWLMRGVPDIRANKGH